MIIPRDATVAITLFPDGLWLTPCVAREDELLLTFESAAHLTDWLHEVQKCLQVLAEARLKIEP